jgi:predicted MFS family arabinose efflux permease
MRSPGGLLAACCLAMGALGVVTNVPALCLTSIAADLHLDNAQSGVFLSCAFWGLVTSIPLAGPAADRWGFRYLLVGSGVLQVLGTLLVSYAHGPVQACLGAMVAGLGTGILDALLTPLACAAFPSARAWTANVLHAFYPMGMFLVVLVVLVLTHFEWDWRSIYRAVAAANVPYAVLFALMPLPRHAHQGPTRMPVRRLLDHGAFLFVLLSIFLAGVTELGPSQWLPAYLEQAAGSSRFTSALGLLLLGTMMALGRLGNSVLARHANPRWLVAGGAALALVSLVLAAVPAGTFFSLACLGLLGLGISGVWPSLLSLAGNRFPDSGAAMYSLLSASGNLGGLVGPLSIGLVAQAGGLRLAMATLALAPAMILLTLAVDRYLARRPSGPS